MCEGKIWHFVCLSGRGLVVKCSADTLLGIWLGRHLAGRNDAGLKKRSIHLCICIHVLYICTHICVYIYIGQRDRWRGTGLTQQSSTHHIWLWPKTANLMPSESHSIKAHGSPLPPVSHRATCTNTNTLAHTHTHSHTSSDRNIMQQGRVVFQSSLLCSLQSSKKSSGPVLADSDESNTHHWLLVYSHCLQWLWLHLFSVCAPTHTWTRAHVDVTYFLYRFTVQ